MTSTLFQVSHSGSPIPFHSKLQLSDLLTQGFCQCWVLIMQGFKSACVESLWTAVHCQVHIHYQHTHSSLGPSSLLSGACCTASTASTCSSLFHDWGGESLWQSKGGCELRYMIFLLCPTSPGSKDKGKLLSCLSFF